MATRLPIMIDLGVASDRDVSALFGPDGEEKSTILKELHLKESSWRDGDIEYKLLQYKRPLHDRNAETSGVYRSVVHRDGNVVCMAPPKALRMEVLSVTHSAYGCMAEEVVEGTMVNLFYDAGAWRLATRGTVGAKCRFYKGSTTFRVMFLEAANYCNLDFDVLPKDQCYSFVLQHPDNRIVAKVDNPQLSLVDTYQLVGTRATRVGYTDELATLLAETTVAFPDRWPISDFQSAVDMYASPGTHYATPGIMFRVGDSYIRAKVRNPNYEAVRSLRGNHPKEQFRYLTLRQLNEVDNYLSYYPEDRETFAAFSKQTDSFVKLLHSSYVRARPMREGDESVDRYLLPHVRALHKIYLRALRPQGRRVHRQVVESYVRHLPAARLMYAINYPLRSEAGVSQHVGQEEEEGSVVDPSESGSEGAEPAEPPEAPACSQ